MCLNLYDSQFKCLQDSGYYADAFPQSDISVVMCSRQSSLPAKCFLWKNMGKWRPGSSRQSFQGLVLSSQRVDTLTKKRPFMWSGASGITKPGSPEITRFS